MYNIKVARGNVVNATAEAVVTPANNNLMPGKGISKMVFYSAGQKLIEACSRLKYCETGCTVVTPGYNLPAQYIIHAVGPWWHGGYAGEAEQLAATYISIMRDVRKLGIESVAIPAICTGFGGYPMEEAADIAVASVMSYLQSHRMNTEVLFMCNDVDTLYAYRTRINEGTSDVSKFFGRKEIKISTKMNEAELKLLKKKLFKKEVEPEAIQQAVTSVLKRTIKKKYPDCTILLNRKNENISMKTVEKYKKSGPFITGDSLQEYSYNDGRMKMRLIPFTFVDTPEEIESKKEIYQDVNENGIPDRYENGIASSFQERPQVSVVNVEALIYGENKENYTEREVQRVVQIVMEDNEELEQGLETKDETMSVEETIPVSPQRVKRQFVETKHIFTELTPEENEQMDYMYEITKDIDEGAEYFMDIVENEIVETSEFGLFFTDDDHIGMPLDEYPLKATKYETKNKNKSKYWPNFKPNYKDREYQKKIHQTQSM